MIATDRVTLRKLTLTDAERLEELVEKNRERLAAYFAWVAFSHGIESARSFIEMSMDDFIVFGLVCDNFLVGTVALAGIDRMHQSAKIACWICSEYEGLDVAATGMQRMVDYAFSELGLHRIQADIMPSNALSQKLAERLGFEREGIARESYYLNGTHHDMIQYSLIREKPC